MLDNCGRTIDYLRLSVTDLCNYRCRYCMPPEGVEKRPHGDILSIEELSEIAAAAAACGVKKIRLTGGEPLVRRGLIELVRQLRAIPGVEELCLTTNGSLLPRLARPLREAGLDRLNISLDTLRPDRFAAMTRLGTLRDVLDGIQAAEAAGFEDLKLDTVLIGGFNDDEIGDFVDLSRDRPWELRFIELMPMGPCASRISSARRLMSSSPPTRLKYEASYIMLAPSLPRAAALLSLDDDPLALEVGEPSGHGVLG